MLLNNNNNENNIMFQNAENVLSNDALMFSTSGVERHKNIHKFHLRQMCQLGFNYSMRHDISAMKKYILYLIPR